MRPRFTPARVGLTGNTIHMSVRVPVKVAEAVDRELAKKKPDLHTRSDVLNDALGLWLASERD